MKHKGYKITIALLCFLVIFEGVWIAGLLSRRKKAPVAAVPLKGKIAIVIDDWGYNLRNLDILSRIKYPLTMAVLPNINYSSSIARSLHNMGFEIILHLPMEPDENVPLEKNTILSSMNGPKIISILDKDLGSLKYARGVSNHMGSKLTRDPRSMAVVFGELKKRRLYFLDSYVTSSSVCPSLAKRQGVKFFKRNVFLDNYEDAVYIKKQIEELKMIALSEGEAIGIGHNYRVTLKVLEEVLPRLAKEGYKFVFVSQL